MTRLRTFAAYLYGIPCHRVTVEMMCLGFWVSLDGGIGGEMDG